MSVLFVDLVGFTTFSEGRDPEAVREMLSEYFEQARRIVDRYGGTIEKFIGDAVMAVWGTPVARENDAERAVRAGLELVDAVAAMGEVAGAELRARGGVVTGEAAVWLDAVAQSMVAGDVVNTAARIQGQAEPGTVYVDEGTREASARSIGYRPAGDHELKGKADTITLYRAEFVIAGDSGAMRFDGLEAPLVGRERDLRLVKEMFHDSAEESRARLVVVSGVAGVGKSRLGWEFFKYLDGLALDVFWHVGRCLSYGEGVAYWALADMVRMRLRIAEGDPDDLAAQRLDEGLSQYVDDAEERTWLRPRMAALLGLDSGQTGAEVEQESLFAGWRLFIERLAQRDPVVLLFEDVQFADAGLLDFVEHLLERSAGLPIFMVALTRPELWDERPDWAGRARGVTSLTLDRLSDTTIESMVDALVTGLPDGTKVALAARAEGIPLFAIETVRMLIDRDVVVPQGGVYVLATDVGDLSDLDVPPTLHALVAARLDNLPEAQRRLVKDASVLGLSFTREALEGLEAAVGGVALDEIDGLLADLIRREVLSVHTDPRSPEAGQYRFLQKVMRTVAFDTLSRRDRKARHLAAAAHWESTADADDLAGVIATHYLEAADAVPDALDADDLRTTSVVHLERAGDRARALAAADEASRYYERALELASNDDDRARLAERAGSVAFQKGDDERALPLLSIARRINEEAGRHGDLARVAALEGDALMSQSRQAEAVELLTAVVERTKDSPVDAGQAQLAATLSAAYWYTSEMAMAFEWIERACVVAEATGGGDPLLRAMNAKGLLLVGDGRPVEGMALLRATLDLAVQQGLDHRAALQAGNLALMTFSRDLAAADELGQRSLDHAARGGQFVDHAFALQAQALVRLHRGTWNDVDLDALRAAIETSGSVFVRGACALPLVAISCWRGQADAVSTLVAELDEENYDHDIQARGQVALMGALAAPHGRDQAVVDATTAFELAVEQGTETDDFAITFPVLVHLAVDAGDVGLARDSVDVVKRRPAGLVPPLLRAQLAWLEDLVETSASPDGQVGRYESAIEQLRAFGARFWLAWALTDRAEWLVGTGHAEGAIEPAREAMQIFDELGAEPFLQRAAALAGIEVAPPIKVALVE